MLIDKREHGFTKNNIFIRFLLRYHSILHKYSRKKNKMIYVFFNALYSLIIQLIYNAYIPATATLGKNIFFPHGFNGIFISGAAKVGEGCIIFHHVTIGSTFLGSKSGGAPLIGKNCLFGAGSKNIGNIRIGDNVKIASNISLNEDIPDNQIVVPNKLCYIKKYSINLFVMESIV